MAHKLVIVESPAKARTIGGYLGDDYVVESSVGHIRDLPNSAADTPAAIKDKPWGRLAVDVDNGFISLLRRAARQAEPHRQAQGPCSRTPTSSTSPPTRTARARRSPGTSSTS